MVPFSQNAMHDMNRHGIVGVDPKGQLSILAAGDLRIIAHSNATTDDGTKIDWVSRRWEVQLDRLNLPQAFASDRRRPCLFIEQTYEFFAVREGLAVHAVDSITLSQLGEMSGGTHDDVRQPRDSRFGGIETVRHSDPEFAAIHFDLELDRSRFPLAANFNLGR